jgi:hypothetical protein
LQSIPQPSWKEENMLAHLVVTMLVAAVSTPASGVESASDVQVRVDSERREVVVTVGRIHIPEAMLYSFLDERAHDGHEHGMPGTSARQR